jgi:hypothetical protein
MSTPDFRQPNPADALKGALAAHARVTDALREAASETEKEGAPENPPLPAAKRTGEQTK